MPQYINKSINRIVRMHGDNQSVLALVKNPHLYKRFKHINISYHFIRDLAEKKKLEIIYILIDEIIADGITKPLVKIAYKRFRE